MVEGEIFEHFGPAAGGRFRGRAGQGIFSRLLRLGQGSRSLVIRVDRLITGLQCLPKCPDKGGDADDADQEHGRQQPGNHGDDAEPI